MFQPTAYLSWAMQFYGKVPYDLATSGIPHVATSSLSPDAEAFDDYATLERLHDAVARYNDVPRRQVFPAMGTSHAIFLAYASLLSPGDEILVESPGYEPLLRCAEGLGAVVRRFERPEAESFRVDPDRVAAAMTPRTRAIVVTNLHNPSGTRLDADVVSELATIAEAQGAYVLVDEVYAPFVDLPVNGVFTQSARKLAPNVLAVGSLTKCYGLGKHRIGWVLGPEEIVERARAAAIATVGHYPIPYAAYGLAGFAQVGALAKRAKSLLADKRAVADEWARSRRGARWSAPREGLFGLVTVPGRGDLRPAIERLATEQGVLVGAGSFFGAPESFRLSWASCDEAKLREGLRQLEAIF